MYYPIRIDQFTICPLEGDVFIVKGAEWTLSDVRLFRDDLDDYDQTTIFMMMTERQRRYAFNYKEDYKEMVKLAEKRRKYAIEDAYDSFYYEWEAYKEEWLRITGQDMVKPVNAIEEWRKKRQIEKEELTSKIKNAIESMGDPVDHASMQNCRGAVRSLIRQYNENIANEDCNAIIIAIYQYWKPEEEEQPVSELDSIHMTYDAKRIMHKLEKKHKNLIKFLKKASYEEIYEHEKTFHHASIYGELNGMFDSIKRQPK